MAKKFWHGAGRVSAEMLSSLAIFTAGITAIVLFIRPGMRKYKNIDLEIFKTILAHTNETNTRIMSFFTLLGKPQFLIPADLSLIAYFLFIRKNTWLAIRIASIALSSLGLMFLLKTKFKRSRPIDPLVEPARGLSFPSGHALMAVTGWGLIIYIITRLFKNGPLKWTLIILLLAMILLVGFSRVYLRVHYASDVAAGYIIGLLWLLVSLRILQEIENYYKEKYRLVPASL